MLAKTKIKLLLIEKDIESRTQMIKHLHEFNNEVFRIVEASDGLEGIQKLKNEEFHLIITELKSDKKSAVDICAYLKTLDLKAIPQVLITSQEISPDDVNMLREIGQKNFMIKPIQKEVFVKKALELLRSK